MSHFQKLLLCFTVAYAVLGSTAYVREWVAVDSKPVDTGVRRVAMVTLDAQLYNVVGDGVLNSVDVGRLGVLHGEVLYGGSVRVVHVLAKEVWCGIQFFV